MPPSAHPLHPDPHSAGDVQAAGAVVFRRGGEVLLVHRPKYDDWSFPKGKLDRGEAAPAAAVREVEEETGLRIRLGVPLSSQRYPISRGHKRVHYWAGRVVGGDDVTDYTAGDEIDQVSWVHRDEAADRLSYPHDVATLGEATRVKRRTRPLVVMRHGEARSRRLWRGEDRDRPLLVTGRQQVERLVPVLAAYDVRRLVSSSSLRCVESLAAYARVCGEKLETEDRLSEEDATRKGVRRVVEDVLLGLADPDGPGAVLCTHRPVLPWVFDALALEDPGLEPGEALVVHQRDGRVRGTERHRIGSRQGTGRSDSGLFT